jgi:hypothetical protein
MLIISVSSAMPLRLSDFTAMFGRLLESSIVAALVFERASRYLNLPAKALR